MVYLNVALDIFVSILYHLINLNGTEITPLPSSMLLMKYCIYPRRYKISYKMLQFAEEKRPW